MTGGVIVDDSFRFQEETQLTVRKTSLFFPGDGFLVYDPNGEIIFRVDSYGPDSHLKDELVLMDALGKCLLTLHRKRPSLRRRWEGFLGERKEEQNPIFSVSRSSLIRRSSVVVEICNHPGEEYHIEGSYCQRCCIIYRTTSETSTKDIVAEIKRKVDPTTKMVVGKDVFALCLAPGFDAAFAMGLVLVLDQMYGDDDVDHEYEANLIIGDHSS